MPPIFKGNLLGWDIFNVVNFENLIYMKLYNLLILTENTKKSKKQFEAPKKSEIVIFPRRILPCKQNKSAIWMLCGIHYFITTLKTKLMSSYWVALIIICITCYDCVLLLCFTGCFDRHLSILKVVDIMLFMCPRSKLKVDEWMDRSFYYSRPWVEVIIGKHLEEWGTKASSPVCSRPSEPCRAKPKGSSCLIFRWAVTAFWLCRAELQTEAHPSDQFLDTFLEMKKG